MALWIFFTLFAAAMQTLRFTLQKALHGAGLSSAGATFARFLYAAPLALLAAALLSFWRGTLPLPPPSFWAFAAAGGLVQILATDLTVRLFGLRNFAVGVAFTKTEVVQVALVAALILGEGLSLHAALAIGLGLLGILALSRPPEKGAPFWGPSAFIGLAAGAFFALSSVFYRGAVQSLLPLPFFDRALYALAVSTSLQSLTMAAWLAWREPGALARVLASWRWTAPVGVTGLLGSLGWFAAFALQNAAYVRALGQVEIVFTLLASVFVFGERLKAREALGIALILAAVLWLVQAAGP